MARVLVFSTSSDYIPPVHLLPRLPRLPLLPLLPLLPPPLHAVGAYHFPRESPTSAFLYFNYSRCSRNSMSPLLFPEPDFCSTSPVAQWPPWLYTSLIPLLYIPPGNSHQSQRERHLRPSIVKPWSLCYEQNFSHASWLSTRGFIPGISRLIIYVRPKHKTIR